MHSVGGEIEDYAFLCKATSLPGYDIGNIDVTFRGRDIKIAGDRTIADGQLLLLMIQISD